MRLQRKTAAIADHSSDEESDGDVDEYGGDFLGDAHRYPLNVSHLAVAVHDTAVAVDDDRAMDDTAVDANDDAPSDATNREPVVETVMDDNDESDAEIVDIITPPRHHDNTMHRCPPTLNKVRDHISYVPSTPGPIVHPITNQPIFDEECDSPPTFLAKLNETEHDVEDEEMQVSTMKGM